MLFFVIIIVIVIFTWNLPCYLICHQNHYYHYSSLHNTLACVHRVHPVPILLAISILKFFFGSVVALLEVCYYALLSHFQFWLVHLPAKFTKLTLYMLFLSYFFFLDVSPQKLDISPQKLCSSLFSYYLSH